MLLATGSRVDMRRCFVMFQVLFDFFGGKELHISRCTKPNPVDGLGQSVDMYIRNKSIELLQSHYQQHPMCLGDGRQRRTGKTRNPRQRKRVECLLEPRSFKKFSPMPMFSWESRIKQMAYGYQYDATYSCGGDVGWCQHVSVTCSPAIPSCTCCSPCFSFASGNHGSCRWTFIRLIHLSFWHPAHLKGCQMLGDTWRLVHENMR